MSDLLWDFCQEPVDDAVVQEIARRLGIVFPPDYAAYIKQHHGGMPNKTDFDYTDPKKKAKSVSCLSQLLSFDLGRPENIVNTYRTLADDYFPKGIIPFGDSGYGDYICFDYRSNAQNPTVVLWQHEEHVEKSIVWLSNTFLEFLGMLYEPDSE